MTEIFIIVASGGRYEDAWDRNICACHSEQAAQETIDNLVRWLGEIRAMELPESLAEHNFDFEDDEDSNRFAISLYEFKTQVLIDMGVPEYLHDWLEENWDSTYCDDAPSYRINEVVLA